MDLSKRHKVENQFRIFREDGPKLLSHRRYKETRVSDLFGHSLCVQRV
jgi:hypothetical protein